jgi:hypothetical protein
MQQLQQQPGEVMIITHAQVSDHLVGPQWLDC